MAKVAKMAKRVGHLSRRVLTDVIGSTLAGSSGQTARRVGVPGWHVEAHAPPW
jgi:hypothetical protein